MTDRLRFLLTLVVGALILPRAAGAQQARDRRPRVVVLYPFPGALNSRHSNALRDGLAAAGYAVGRDAVLEVRSTEGREDALPTVIERLIDEKPAVVVAIGEQPARALVRATTTLPIIVMFVGDPVRTGLVKSLTRPRGQRDRTHPHRARTERQASRATQGACAECGGSRCPGIRLIRTTRCNGRQRKRRPRRSDSKLILSRCGELRSRASVLQCDPRRGRRFDRRRGQPSERSSNPYRRAGVPSTATCSVPGRIRHGGGRLGVIWTRLRREVSASGRVRWQNPRWREGFGASSSATHQVQSDPRSQDRQGPRPHDSSRRAGARKSGDRITRENQMSGPFMGGEPGRGELNFRKN